MPRILFATLDKKFVVVEYFAMCIQMDKNKWTFWIKIYEKYYLFKMFGQHMFMTKDLKD
jgi:hypothetical protein